LDALFAELDRAASLQAMLGYLNFSEGKPDPRFQKQVNDAYAFLADRGAAEPWTALHEALWAKLGPLKAGGTGPFRDVRQAEAVLSLVFAKVLSAYRRHHADLLFHQNDRDLFGPFFLARVFEAVLAQGSPWDEDDRILKGALARLNDFAGYRPTAILETRPKGEPYEHERVRPIPLFIRGAGVAWGRYHDLVSKALDILTATDPGLLADAQFDPELLDEFAVDPRAYDHGHPVNRRPNYLFGEWDPDHLDGQGRYRRYVARQVTLDALLDRVEKAREVKRGVFDYQDPSVQPLAKPGEIARDEALDEAAAVLAGTVLMAAGSSGGSPTAYDSSVTLSTLVPRIAHYRDAFYTGLLDKLGGAHGDRLRREAEAIHQPFGGARRHLNQYLAGHRAAQLQQRHLALLFAQMGYPEASRREAGKIPAASVRMLSEIVGRLITGQLLAEEGQATEAARLLPEVEDLLRRGIACGALVDPWNVLGFQALFPLFTAQEDSVRDQRSDELIGVMRQLFDLYTRVLSEAAAAGEGALVAALTPDLRRLAGWWDRFATLEVGDVPRVHGGEAAASAEHVAAAMARWHERGEATGDLAFWRQHLEGFRSPEAFALVVGALLDKEDYRAAMALLMTWLGQVEQVPLEDGPSSFHALALEWMLALTSPADGADAWPLVKKFIDYLEANAEDYWQVPTLEVSGPAERGEEAAEGLYGAAYEGVTFRDSADDDQEGAVADGGGPREEFDLQAEGERLVKRLRFLSTVARLWHVGSGYRQAPAEGAGRPPDPEREQVLLTWQAAARANHERLLALLDAIHGHKVPEPLGSFDSLVEFDRRRGLKEQLLYAAIATCLDTFLAVGSLESRNGAAGPSPGMAPDEPAWVPLAVRLEQALFRGDRAEARAVLPEFIRLFQDEPLLFVALADGGHPRQILRVRTAQTILRALVMTLPRVGLLRETFHLLRTAHRMEQAHPPRGRGVTEFNPLFQTGFQEVVKALVEAAPTWGPAGTDDREFVNLLERVTEPFLKLWMDHSHTLLLSPLELVRGEDGWGALREFVARYGGDLFQPRFLALANLRGILRRGVSGYLDYLRDNPDPLHPVRLVEDLDRGIRRDVAVRHLTCVLQALVENYEEYKDYNTGTTQSDYGENLHVLLDFLRLKAGYERQSWHLRPLVLAHQVLARGGRPRAAALWQEPFREFTGQLADQHLAELHRLEAAHGVRLRTVADRLGERFLRPLDLDRLCALVKPAMEEARTPGERPAFARLEQELGPFTANPTGVGLDVPDWLRRLEMEVQAARAAATPVATLAEVSFQLPRRPVTFAELQDQLREWEKPTEPS
jgi:hypothetical protein